MPLVTIGALCIYKDSKPHLIIESMSRASSHHKAGKDRAGSDCAISEASAVRLVYSMRKEPEQDRYM